MPGEYKPHPKGFYHAYSLKSLTRLRDRLVRQRFFYLVKITNVLDHTFPEFKPFFHGRVSKTALYLLENYGSAEKMARMNSASYEKLRSLSRGRFSPQHFLQLKELAANTVGINNSIFDIELNSLLTLYKSLVKEIGTLETEINKLIEEVHPHYMSVPGIGPISAAVIYSEYGDVSNFSTPAQMLAFAGMEPGINESGTESHRGRMVKHGSSQLRYVLINCCLPCDTARTALPSYGPASSVSRCRRPGTWGGEWRSVSSPERAWRRSWICTAGLQWPGAGRSSGAS